MGECFEEEDGRLGLMFGSFIRYFSAVKIRLYLASSLGFHLLLVYQMLLFCLNFFRRELDYKNCSTVMMEICW